MVVLKFPPRVRESHMAFDFFGGSMHADSPTPDDRESRSGHVRPNGRATRFGRATFHSRDMCKALEDIT